MNNTPEYNRGYWQSHGHQQTKTAQLEQWRRRALLAEAEEARLRAIVEEVAPERVGLPQRHTFSPSACNSGVCAICDCQLADGPHEVTR